jgi:hypothetical protein
MPELELALVELGGSIDFPPTPDLTSRVRERIAAERPPRRSFLPARRTLAIALAVAAVAIGALMAVPGTRAAILEFFGVRGVAIEHVETLPTVPKNVDLNLGERVTLEEARELAGFDVLLPEKLGEPDEVWFSDSPPGGMVSFVYGSSEEPRALLTQFRATFEDTFLKKLEANTNVQHVGVNDEPGVYLSGPPHVFGYVDSRGQYREETMRLVGNVLLWEQRPLTLRLEADLPLMEALEIARSTR